MILQLLLLAAGLFGARQLSAWQVRHHNKLIRLDGSKDSLKHEFHTTWFLIRLALVVAGALLVHLPVAGWMFWLRSGLFTLAAFWYFGLTFNPQLNLRQGKARWYFSREPDAAWTDRTIVKVATVFNLTPEEMGELVFKAGMSYSVLLYLTTYLMP